jgi:ribose/xylose/arabinose/galactoside ABC-type transport system permease subunit
LNNTNTSKKNFIQNMKLLQSGTEISVFMVYIFLCVAFAFMSPYFFTVRNFMNIGIYSAIMGVTATGMTLALIAGGFDVSVGSIMAITGMGVAMFLDSGGNWVIAIILGLAIGLVCGIINGMLITRAGINPLITTLATMSVFRGFAYIYTNGVSISIRNTSFKWLGSGFVFGIPTLIIIVILAFVVMFYVLKFTAFGRKVYAVGNNARASKLSGININRVKLMVWSICGVTAGISGIMIAAQTGAGLPQAGTGMEMDIIAACVLGGCSISGGKGSVWGTLLGVLILSTLSNGLNLTNVQSFWQLIIKGLALLTAVLIDVLRRANATA